MEHLKGFTKGFEKLRGVGVFGSMGSALGIYNQKQLDSEELKVSPKARAPIEYADELGDDGRFYPKLYPNLDVDYMNNNNNAPLMQSFDELSVPMASKKHPLFANTMADSDDEDDFLLIEHSKIAPNCNTYYLPFSQSVELCHRLIQNWLEQIWFLPSDWRVSLKILPPKPHYVPFFVFNVETTTKYEASVQVDSKDPGSPGKRWEAAEGKLSSHYEEVIACASWSMNLELVKRLLEESGFSFHSQRSLPVDPRVYDPSTFQGEEPILPLELTKDEAWENYVRLRIFEWEEQKARDLLKQNYELFNANSQIRGLRVEPIPEKSSCFVILLPIYVTGVEYANSKFEILVSGNRGQVVGNRPMGTGSGGKYILDKIKAVGTLVSDTIPL